MIEIIRSVVTLSFLLISGLADMAHAHLDDDSPSQLRLIDPQNRDPSMHMIDTAGFPAIAASGTEVAVLRTLDAAWESVAFDVMRVEGGRVLKRFILIPEFSENGDPRAESARPRLAADIVTPNAYLAEGKFKPMKILFDQTRQNVSDWELKVRGMHIQYENDGSILQITSMQDKRRHLRLEWPARVLPPMGPGGMIQCGIRGIPMKAWIDATGELIVLNIWHSGGPAHGCDEPEEWRVVRLPQ